MSSLLAGPPRRSQWLVVSVNRFRAVTAAAACGTGTAAPGNLGPRAATRATLRAAARAEEIMMQTAGNKTRTGPADQRSNGCDSCGGLIVAQADANCSAIITAIVTQPIGSRIITKLASSTNHHHTM